MPLLPLFDDGSQSTPFSKDDYKDDMGMPSEPKLPRFYDQLSLSSLTDPMRRGEDPTNGLEAFRKIYTWIPPEELTIEIILAPSEYVAQREVSIASAVRNIIQVAIDKGEMDIELQSIPKMISDATEFIASSIDELYGGQAMSIDSERAVFRYRVWQSLSDVLAQLPTEIAERLKSQVFNERFPEVYG